MRHLSPQDLLDVAEDTQSEAAFPHLVSCEVCRRHVAELRDVMRAAAVEVPEPSPLFWDYLSARVREAIGEPAGHWSRWARVFSPWRLGGAVAAIAVVLVVATMFVSTPQQAPASGTPPSDRAGVAERADSSAEDPSLDFVADLAAGLDWDSVAEAGITITTESAAVDRAVMDLSVDERAELQRLLSEALRGV